MPNPRDTFLRHFTAHLGKPFDVQVYRQEDGPPLRLATFDQTFANYRVYGSLGLSERPEVPAAEAVLLADDPGKDVPFIFINSLFFILQRKIPLQTGLVIGGVEMINPDFAEYFNKAALYYTLADDLRPGLGAVELGDDSGEVYQALFVSWAEQDYIKRHGHEAFAKRLAEQDADPCSLQRPSCA